jgi:hypothetical protein
MVEWVIIGWMAAITAWGGCYAGRAFCADIIDLPSRMGDLMDRLAPASAHQPRSHAQSSPSTSEHQIPAREWDAIA